MKPGDWECSCGRENFARRMSCFSCGKPRPSCAKRDGDWKCPTCTFLNFGCRVSCKNCATPKVVEKPAVERPGDWYCKCGTLNFGSRTACFACGTPRTQGAQGTTVAQEVNICCICIDRRINRVLPCGHTFCLECILSQQVCPKCRQPFDELGIKRLFLDD